MPPMLEACNGSCSPPGRRGWPRTAHRSELRGLLHSRCRLLEVRRCSVREAGSQEAWLRRAAHHLEDAHRRVPRAASLPRIADLAPEHVEPLRNSDQIRPLAQDVTQARPTSGHVQSAAKFQIGAPSSRMSVGAGLRFGIFAASGLADDAPGEGRGLGSRYRGVAMETMPDLRSAEPMRRIGWRPSAGSCPTTRASLASREPCRTRARLTWRPLELGP